MSNNLPNTHLSPMRHIVLKAEMSSLLNSPRLYVMTHVPNPTSQQLIKKKKKQHNNPRNCPRQIKQMSTR
ncbi:hypothetical protein HID58_047203 [Brassica napus]|uniref:Uncharacterized protein n=1 Tax=Brassica napus TaxID=3708 RepID=A0ABQ8AYK5_BRANA|nr:hypothetical protein HID58_047203 [Brassica napus]